MSLSVLNFESFIQLGGIYVKTIEYLFNYEIFYLARETMHVTFFEHFMADDASCMALHSNWHFPTTNHTRKMFRPLVPTSRNE